MTTEPTVTIPLELLEQIVKCLRMASHYYECRKFEDFASLYRKIIADLEALKATEGEAIEVPITSKERSAIIALAHKADLPPHRVMIQALRLYQSTVELAESPLKLGDD